MRPSEALARNRDKVLEILSRYPVKNPKVFGSVARGEDTENSDLDLLVEKAGPLTYPDIIGIQSEIGAAIGATVGIHTRGEFREKSLQRIDADARDL